MKIFSSLLAGVMMFACLSVAYADIAPYPRPRPNVDNQDVTATIDDSGNVSVKIRLPYECRYKYRLVYFDTGAKIFSGKGKYKSGDTITKSANLRDKLSDDKNYFALTIEMSDIQTQTRFGTKTRSDTITWNKTLLVEKISDGKFYRVNVYGGEP